MNARPTSLGTDAQAEAALRQLGRRTEAELTRVQLAAIDAWHRARKVAEEATRVREASREARMDLNRRLDVLRAQHQAIIARADRQLAQSVHLLGRSAPLRALVVHRNAWYVDKVAARLEAGGIQVLDRLENGAEAVGVVVAEQPDLLLVEDVLPMLSGEQVVRETKRFSPETLVVGQVAYSDRVEMMLAAGADTAFTRQVPPQDVARDVVELVTARV